MANATLETLRASLLEKQRELQRRVESLEKDLSQARSPDFAEQVTERENDDVLREIAREAREEIQRITHAIMRIDEDTYGSCERCGAEISAQRLAAIPNADYCIGCAQAMESQ
jgi:DnaK suppressor protein